jgi:hypothetical protein
MSLNIGNRWLYQSTSPMGASRQELRVADWDRSVGLNALIEMDNLKTGVVTTDLVTCLEGGGIEDFPLFFVSMEMGDYLPDVFNTFYESGIYSPAYAEFVAQGWQLGWQAEYLTEDAICLMNPLKTGDLCINRSSPIQLVFETRGEYEPVTVPAGSFPNALKVQFSFTLATTLSFPTLATSAPLTVITTQWYQPFVGLLRSQVESASLALMPDQDSAVSLDSVVELVDYTLVP